MRVCQLKVITSIDHRDRTLQDFYADLELVAVRHVVQPLKLIQGLRFET
jgi:hypothetical protein